jgi:hypothetical protein
VPLVYFHLRDGTDVLLDPEGRDVADLDAIPQIALHEARAIIAADARDGQILLDQRIDVEDEAGQLVHRLHFADAVTITPAKAR